MSSRKHILIVGSGSVGKRHAKNLGALGCDISAIDTRADRLNEIKRDFGAQGVYRSLAEAFRSGSTFDGAVVASPTAFHVDQAIALLKKKIPVLLEKPVSRDYRSALRLQKAVQKSKVHLLLGYTWRWWGPLAEVKRRIDNGEVGPLRHISMRMSAHLADWHPWEDYRDFFMSSKKLGGGALLDESHWLDLMIWFRGLPRSVLARVEKISDLKIETDDNVDLILDYPGNLRAAVHLDLYGRPHEKSIIFCGEKGSMKWTADPNQIALGKSWKNEWRVIKFTCERNDMFVAVAKEFLRVLNGKRPETCSVSDGVKVLKLIEAIRKSSKTSKIVKIKG